MQNCWTSFDITDTKAFIVKEKFKMLKDKLRGWNKEVFGIMDLNIETVVKVLNDLDMVLQEKWDRDVLFQRNEVSAKFWKDIWLKESLLCQKSQAKWIREGDSNSKYFHSLMRFNRQRTNLRLLDANGILLEDMENVKSIVNRHFEVGFEEPSS